MNGDDTIEAKILELCRARGPDKTICPSEVARALGGDETDWRERMPAVRDAAGRLAEEGVIEVTQKGKPVDANGAKGPIRLGLKHG